MPRVYHRFKPHNDATPITFTEVELQRVKRDRIACVEHLIDLMREFDAANVGEGKARYRQKHELDILPGSDFRPVTPRREELSYCGSPAALSAGF